MSATSNRITERSEYLKKVLAPAVKNGTTPDLFTRYALDFDEDDQRVITSQVDFVVKLWRNSTNHEKYGELVRRLLKEHPGAEQALKDPAKRQGARNDILRSRHTSDRARFEELESLMAELRDHSGALPESTREHLVDVGRALGLNDEEIGSTLSTERFVDDTGATRPTLEIVKYKTLDDKLNSLRGLLHAEEVGPTLFSLIGVPFSANRQQLRASYEAARSQNDKRPYGDEKTHASRVLVDVRRYLVEGDPDLYRHAVVASVKNALSKKVEQRKRLHDRLGSGAFRSLVADAIRLGLDEKWANIAIRELASAERVAIEGVGPQSPSGSTQQPPAQPVAPWPRQPPQPPQPRFPQQPPVPEPVPPWPRDPPRAPRSPQQPPAKPVPPWLPPVDPPQPPRPPGQAYSRPGAAYWWLPVLFPLLGAPLSWLWASISARRLRYVGIAAVWFLLALIVSSASSHMVGEGPAVVVWLASIVHVLRRRKSVRDEIRMRSAR